MAENFPFPTYFVLTMITITRLISTVGKTELTGPSLVPENISHRLRDDADAIKIASSDYGNLVRESPLAVFHPSSIYDIIGLIRSSYTSSVPFHIAARGHGHSTRGQAMAPNGVVVDMSVLRRQRLGFGISFGISSVFHDPSVGYYADVGGEQLWIDVLQATLQHGLAPASWTDYLYLTVGGTLSNAGISGQTFRYGPQISIVHEMDVITGINLLFFY